jgi:ferric-dicitrate binding protein FerR (iron transport regulator)
MRRGSVAKRRDISTRSHAKRGARGPARVSARRPYTSARQEHALAFDGETLSEAIAEVSRQTGWPFELADPELGEMRVEAMSADPEAFIELVSSSLGLEARREGERRVVLSRRS